MSFETVEASLEDGQPIYLYRFTLGTTVWRYTSHDRAVIRDDVDANGNLVGNAVWSSIAISDDGIKQSGEPTSDTLVITAPISAGPVQVHLMTAPATPVRVAILQSHEGNLDVRAIYSGDVINVDPSDPAGAKLSTLSTSSSMQMEGLRLGYQRGCPYALYDEVTCKVDQAAYGVAMRVTDKSGYTLLTTDAGTKPDGWFAGGFITWVHPIRGPEFRGIENHSQNAISIFGRTEDIYLGLVITAYPGCARTSSECASKFNNLNNYGGFPAMPGKSPFDGDPVF